MNEVRQVWTSIRSSRSSSSVTESSIDQRTTWYDSPAPVIIHNRDLSGEKMEVAVRNVDDEEATTAVVEEVLYQNNVEAALNSLSKVCAEPLKTEIDLDTSSTESKTIKERRRHSSSVELTATTSLKVDEDGMPQISFSFLGAEEPATTTNDDIVTPSQVDQIHKEVEDPEDTRKVDIVITQDELYDFPKSSAATGISHREIKIQSYKIESQEKIIDDDKVQEVIQDEWYDVPKSVRETALAKERKIPSPETQSRFVEEPDTERSPGLRDSVLSNSGSCSDIESVDGSASDTHQRNLRERRLKRQRRRLGKAWGRMRSWLKEEKSKIGEVVTRHAKMQAVGAMSQENSDSEGPVGARNQSGSYDLTRQRKFDANSVTRVEEFGLSSVSEEAQASSDVEEPRSPSREGDAQKSPDSTKSVEESPGEVAGRRSILQSSFLSKKTKSSENILTGNKQKLTPVSFSLDKLCSDDENDDNNAVSESETSKEQANTKGPGLIRRRMLGSIRGLMASTHLLQAHEIEEVMGLQIVIN